MTDAISESLSGQRDELLRVRDEAIRLCERHAHHHLKEEFLTHLRNIDSAIDHLEKAMKRARERTEHKIAS